MRHALEPLRVLTRRLREAADQTEVCRAIAEAGITVSGAGLAHVWLNDAERRVIRHATTVAVTPGLEPAVTRAVIPHGEGILGRIIGSGNRRLFDLFVQGGRASGDRQGGLGIGLTLVRELVDLHDGTVRAASEGPGKGSTFTVMLPAIESGPRRISPSA